METMTKTNLSILQRMDKTKATSIFTIIGSICTLVFNVLSKLF